MIFINVCQEEDVLGSAVSFFKAAGRIKLDHVVCGAPVQVDLWVMMIYGIDNSHLQSILATLFELRQGHIERWEGLCYRTIFVEFPKVKQFVLSVFVRCKGG